MRPFRKIRRLKFLGSSAAIVLVLVGAIACLVHAIPLPQRLRAGTSAVFEYWDGTVAHVFFSEDERWRIPGQLDDVDPAYVEALLRLEDKRFFRHVGVDPLAVARATTQNLAKGRRVSGASTLTLQLVRVLEPRPRTFGSKLIEAMRALQLEARQSKRELLEAYLTYTPYGRNLEGVAAASWAYFGHSPKHLSPAEICTLLAVPQNPSRRFPSAANVVRLAQARDEIARRLLLAHALRLGAKTTAAEVLAQIQATPAPDTLRRFPRAAPHVAYWLHQHARPEEGPVARIRGGRTTLDAGLQAMAERVLHKSRAELATQGIHDATIVVLDHGSGEVRAAVGNHDFWDSRAGAQVTGFDTPRSPGSALKPLLYALAIDRGLAGPDALVQDTPATYGGWSPRNFDDTFSGLIRLEDALSQSLNLPFVEVLRKVGVEPFIGTLRQMDARSLREAPGHYGLSAAIGGLELTPLELAGTYAMLARGGTYVTPRWRPEPELKPKPDTGGQTLPTGVRIVSPGAAYLTRRALRLRDRPDFPERRRFTGIANDIHWKTGTSFGYRDAWAAGSDTRHTVVVWTGNFDNRASRHLVGAEAAAPLLFDVLEAARSRAPDAAAEADPPTLDLALVEVCSYSGHLPGDACPHRREVLLPRQSVGTARCPFHVRVDVEEGTGLALSPECRSGRPFESRTFVSWPASVKKWLAQQHRVLPEVPAMAAGCGGARVQKPPAIVSPAPGQVALLVPGVPLEEQEIPLEAEADGRAQQLSWFVDGKFIAAAPAIDRVWWTPSPGVHEVYVTDGSGTAHVRRFEVAWKRR